MQRLKTIKTNGYRGKLTGGQYLPPGEYTVGDETQIDKSMVTFELAAHMVFIKMATALAFEPDPDPMPVETTTMPDDPDPADEEPVADAVPPEDTAAPDVEPHVVVQFASYADMTRDDLIDEAKARDLPYSGKTKAALIDMLEQNDQGV